MAHPVYVLGNMKASSKLTTSEWYIPCSIKKRHQTHVSNFTKPYPIFKLFFTDSFSRKFAIKWLIKVPPHLMHVSTLPGETQCQKTSDILKLMWWLTINHKAVWCGKISNSHIFINLLLRLPVIKLFKSANTWQDCRQEGRLHVDDGEQKQFPVTLMTLMHIIDHCVGCAVWSMWKHSVMLLIK